jgi:hypothetical protein
LASNTQLWYRRKLLKWRDWARYRRSRGTLRVQSYLLQRLCTWCWGYAYLTGIHIVNATKSSAGVHSLDATFLLFGGRNMNVRYISGTEYR